MMFRINVATRIKMRSAAMPASSRARTIGGSSNPLGTGRVISQIRMHAEVAPRGRIDPGLEREDIFASIEYAAPQTDHAVLLSA